MHSPDKERYTKLPYRRCGKSGLLLPAISLGLWHNFGNITPFETQQSILRTAFDNGITHFDLANNYGPPYGEAERNFGKHMDTDWRPYRDELVISTKAGYDMWEGPYGNFGSRKYLISSIDQSLKRMHLDYVDIFYHHRPDPDTPIEETMQALCDIVRSGKALYVGISNYNAEQTSVAIQTLKEMGMHLLIHQVNYSMFNRTAEQGLTDVLSSEGVGCIAFCPLAKGVLTGKYINGIPSGSRAAVDPRYIRTGDITEERISKVKKLYEIAMGRGQTLAQMALAWTIRNSVITSALIGASKPSQIIENIGAVSNNTFTDDEISAINAILNN